MKLLFLVNGSEDSPAGLRARAFAVRVPSAWSVRTAYRPARKWRGILPFVREALRFRPDVVYVTDVAYTGVLAGALARGLTRCALVTDTGDAVYELCRSVGTFPPAQLRLIRWTEELAHGRSDCIVVRGSHHAELLREKGLRRVEFIPDGVDLEETRPVDAAPLRAELGLGDELVVGLVGSMTWVERHRICYGWDIIEALPLLAGLPVRALLVGDGDGRARLESRARELGVRERVTFTGRVPYDRLPRYLCAMDVCVSTQSNDIVGRVRTTGKLPLYLACGRYVVATDAGEAGRVLPGAGGLLPYEGVRDEAHPARLAEHLRGLLADRRRLDVTDRARRLARDHFDYDLLSHQVRAFGH